jgi:hypothetical protein
MYSRVPINIDKTIGEELVIYIPIPTIRYNKVVSNTGINLLRLTSVRNETAGEPFN